MTLALKVIKYSV